MADKNTLRTHYRPISHTRTNNENTEIKFIQINLQHSRTATSNLMQIIHENIPDIVLIQEPHIIGNKIIGIPRNYQLFKYGNSKIRAAVLIANKQIDAIMVRHLSDGDAVVVEIIYNNFRCYIASMYLDIENDINTDLSKIDAIKSFTKGAGLLIGMDSNSRSKTWYDTITNARGRTIEEYISANQLHIMNEMSENTTFESANRKSNNELTITNNVLLSKVSQWECGKEESCSDHRYITYQINSESNNKTMMQLHGVKYWVNENLLEKLENSIKLELTKIVPEKRNTDKRHTPNPKTEIKIPDPAGIEPGPPGWKAGTLPTTPRRRTEKELQISK